MKSKIALSLIFLLLFVGNVFPKEPEWLKNMKQVKLLSDTYEDVIKIFGKPIDGTTDRELSEYFDLKEGRIFVNFESGKCVVTSYSGGEPIGWKVPAYTVIYVSFTPNKKIRPKELKLNLTGFRSYEIYDVPGAMIYENDELGIDFSLTPKGYIESITFRPAKKFYHLHC